MVDYVRWMLHELTGGSAHFKSSNSMVNHFLTHMVREAEPISSPYKNVFSLILAISTGLLCYESAQRVGEN